MDIRWDFPLLGTGSAKGVNDAGITMFRGSSDMDGLAREVCQNSLDARREDLPASEPVTVKFRLEEIGKSDHRDIFDEYESALAGAHSFWENKGLGAEETVEFVERAQKSLESDTIPVLIMSDYGTTGLVGSRDDTGFWNALVNTEGVSGKQDKSSAGSFGIGKNAPFAYTSLNLVFYNTFAIDGGRALQGVTHLVTTQREWHGDQVPASDTGKFLCMLDEYRYRPIQPDDPCTLWELDAFKRGTGAYGTDVAIFGFKTEQYDEEDNIWEKQLAVALLKNFMLAIKDGKLVAEVSSPRKRYTVDKDHLESMLFEEFGGESQLRHTRQAYETVTKGDRRDVRIMEDDDLSIYIRYDDRYDRGLSRYRSAGMLINTTPGEVLLHFCVIIVVNETGENKLSKLLRDAEPPQHNEWKAKNVGDNKKRKNQVRNNISKINREIRKLMDEFDHADIQDTMDAGIGSYIPDINDQSGLGEGTDELRTDVKIDKIIVADPKGRKSVIYESGTSATGTRADIAAHKRGEPKKRRKRSDERIPTVNPSPGEDVGAAPGDGKVGVASTPNIVAHRTFRFAGNKYRLHIDSDEDYENVCIYYHAGCEDGSEESLKVKTYKQDGQPLVERVSDCIGPVHIHKGTNDFYIDFETSEMLALIPDFQFGRAK